MKIPNLNFFLVIVFALAFVGSANAHHSTAHFSTEVTEMEGVLVDLQWRNPHVYFFLETQEDNGESRIWEMEAGTIYMIGRAGVTRDLFEVGETIKVAGNKSNLYADKFWVENILTHENKEVLVVAGGQPYFTDELIGGRSQWENAVANGTVNAGAGSGIFRVWSPAVGETSRLDGAPTTQLRQIATETSLAARENWDPYAFDDACEVPGMPRINSPNHPHEFIEDGENIILLGEEFYLPRTIYMDTDADLSQQPYSKLGYSVGRWQDEDTLLIETTRIDYQWLDLSGLGQSPELTVQEKYVFSEAEGRIDYEVIVRDPIMLKQPHVSRGVWFDLGETFDEFDCVPK